MLNNLSFLLFIFVSINWFLIFIPAFKFVSFNWFLIWTLAINVLIITNHPFVDGNYFGETLKVSSFALLVLLLLTFFFIVYLLIIFNSSVSNYKELPLLFLIIYFGFLTLMISNDFLVLYLSIELFSLTFYLITTIHQNYYTTEAGIKYFIYNFLAGAFYLLGCALIYLDYGTISFEDTAILTELKSQSYYGNAGKFGAIFVIVSFLFKLSIAPFHYWTPDVYQGALYPITAFFTIFPKFVIGTFLLKLYLFVLYAPYLNYLLIFCGIVSVFVGSIGALTQYNIKRFFAYSTIANAGFIIILIAMGTPISYQYYLVYILTYNIANLGLFTLLIHFNYSEVSSFKYLGGNLLSPQAVKNGPTVTILAILLAVPVLSLAGLPPLVGFMAKFVTIGSIFNKNSSLIAILLLTFSILSLFYYLRFVHYLHFYKGVNPSIKEAKTSEIVPDVYKTCVATLASLGLLFFSLNPSLLFLLGSVFAYLVP